MDAKEFFYELENMGLEPEPYRGLCRFDLPRNGVVAVIVEQPGDHVLPVGWRLDNMGPEYVVYWPRMAWPFPEDTFEGEN